MKTVLIIKKGHIHSNWTLMQAYKNDDGTFKLSFADKNSNDQIRFELEKEDAERLFRALKPPEK